VAKNCWLRKARIPTVEGDDLQDVGDWGKEDENALNARKLKKDPVGQRSYGSNRRVLIAAIEVKTEKGQREISRKNIGKIVK